MPKKDEEAQPREIVVPVKTEKVEGTIHLPDIVARLETSLKSEAERVKRGRPEMARRMTNATRLAAELRKEIAAVEQLRPRPPTPAPRSKRRSKSKPADEK